ncbi:MAG: hypothetical protein IRZ28_11265 [Steroidobacteraceae bacterium]|nr:hypothetical protein [Steroidobacteraceae bacterium]
MSHLADALLTVVVLAVIFSLALLACVLGAAVAFWVRGLVEEARRARRRSREVAMLERAWAMPPGQDGPGLARR